MAHFWDDDGGGVFTTADDAPPLISRPKDILDNATPSANSLTAVALGRLAALLGDERLRERSEEALSLAAPLVARHPTAFGHLLAAVDLVGPTEVVVVGDRPDLVEAVHAFHERRRGVWKGR